MSGRNGHRFTDVVAEQFDRLPPQSTEAEQAVLGSVVLSREVFEQVRPLLTPDSFAQADNGIIWQVLCEMADAGTPVDLLTLREALASRQLLEEVGGVAYIGQIFNTMPSADHGAHYAAVVAEKAKLRDLLAIGNDLIRSAYEPTRDFRADDIAAGVTRRLNAMTERAMLRTGPALTCLADVEPRQVEWLWPGRIPLGRLTVLVGVPGRGKSYLTCDLAARVTTGTPWPDGAECVAGEVIMLAAEDDAGDTIRPRLDAHHADVSRVHLLSGVNRVGADGRSREVGMTLADVPTIRAALDAHPDCRLLIIDPIGSFLGAGVDAHRDNEVRAILAPVARLAEERNVAVLLVAHRRKSGNGGRADEMVLGSTAFIGIARSVLHLVDDGQVKGRRLLVAGKNNLSAPVDGLAFEIVGQPVGSLSWERDPVVMSADDAVDAERDREKPGPSPEAKRAAADWIAAELAAGPVPSKDIEAAADAAGLSWATVRRAANEIGVIRERIPFGKGWQWRTPKPAESQPAQEPEQHDPKASNMSNLSKLPNPVAEMGVTTSRKQLAQVPPVLGDLDPDLAALEDVFGGDR